MIRKCPKILVLFLKSGIECEVHEYTSADLNKRQVLDVLKETLGLLQLEVATTLEPTVNRAVKELGFKSAGPLRGR